MSQGECAGLWENVPYVKVHWSNLKHLYPKLNDYRDNGKRKVRSSCCSTYCTRFSCCYPYTAHVHSSVLQLSQAHSCCKFIVNRCHSYSELWGAVKMPFVFSHMEYCDMYFVYGFCNGNACAAFDEYWRRFPNWKIPSRGVFSRIHQTICEAGCFPSVAVQSEREVVPMINTWENILEMVQRSPQLFTRRIASHIGVSRM